MRPLAGVERLEDLFVAVAVAAHVHTGERTILRHLDAGERDEVEARVGDLEQEDVAELFAQLLSQSASQRGLLHVSLL